MNVFIFLISAKIPLPALLRSPAMTTVKMSGWQSDAGEH
jgi:hypothetical protein